MRILITAGGTREYIDPVRFISNASSGRMGYALARAALKAGHKVTLITAPSSLRVPEGVRAVRVETAAELFEAVKKNFDKCDCLIMTAAVTDYTPCRKLKEKIKTSHESRVTDDELLSVLLWRTGTFGKMPNESSKKRTLI